MAAGLDHLQVGGLQRFVAAAAEFLQLRERFFDVGMAEQTAVTFGAGLHLPKLNIDYSFAEFDAIDQPGSSHRISIIFTLESEQYRRVKE